MCYSQHLTIPHLRGMPTNANALPRVGTNQSASVRASAPICQLFKPGSGEGQGKQRFNISL
eukprot:4646736-Amphidinium_carterae.1